MIGPRGGALAEFRLDDPEVVEAADSGGLLRRIASAAAQVRTSLRACEEASLALARPRAIVVAAGGASALAGDVLEAVCGLATSVQVTTVRGYQLPGWVGAADLVLGVSASGAGSEARTLAAEAVRRGCDFAGIGPARSPLADIAAQARGAYVAVDSSEGSARASLWALTVPLLFIASRLGVTEIADEEYEGAAAALEEASRACRPSSESFVNPAKSLALDLQGTIPLIWGGSRLAVVAARRFASLLAASARYPAVAGDFPAVTQDQVSILDGPFAPQPAPVFPSAEDLGAELEDDDEGEDGPPEPRVVLIGDPAGEEPVHTRMREATASIAADRGILLSSLTLEGSGPLRRLASIAQLLDYTSAYLGIASGVDPLASPARGDLRNLVYEAD